VMGRLGLGDGRRDCEEVGLGMTLEMGRSIGWEGPSRCESQECESASA
jgi:hypothetical protein